MSDERTISERLAARAAGFSLAARADRETVSRRASELLLDFTGVMVGGLREDSAKIASAHAARTGASGRVGGATLLRVEAGPEVLPVDAEEAAFAHAVAGHGLEMDDVHNASSSHPGVIVIPAALACAEAFGRSGAELLEAIVAGYEVMLEVGVATGPAALYARGFHPTPTCGVFGAAAAAGRLMRLDAGAMADALGLAWSFAGGNMSFQTEGSLAKRIQVGWASRSGLAAARLAAAGARGPRRVFEAGGFCEAYAGTAWPELNAEGDPARPLRILEVSIKPHACCRYIQSPIDAILKLRSDGLTADAVETIDARIASAGLALVAEPADFKRRPSTPEEAQFSLPYSLAVALVAGDAGPDRYRQPWLSDPRVADLASRVGAGSSPWIDDAFPARWGAEVAVRTRDGETRATRLENGLGDPEWPLDEAALGRKFDSLAGRVLDETARSRALETILPWGRIAAGDASAEAGAEGDRVGIAPGAFVRRLAEDLRSRSR